MKNQLLETKSKKSIVSLSGWGQDSKSLNFIFDDPRFIDYDVSSLDYSCFSSVDDFFQHVKSLNLNPEILIGWSLGGQLSLRLIKTQILNPKYLILVAPPFQMVKDRKIVSGMARKVFDEFYHNFKEAPDDVLKKFSILTAMNDKNSKDIAKNLSISEDNFDNLTFWLEELDRFSFFDFDFSKIPQTLFFHGKGDMIVHISQSKYFQERISDFELEIFKNCGHAPHLSDIDGFRQKVLEFVNSVLSSSG